MAISCWDQLPRMQQYQYIDIKLLVADLLAQAIFQSGSISDRNLS